MKGRSQAIDKPRFLPRLPGLRICISQKGMNCSPSNANHWLRKVWLQQPKGLQPLKDKASSTLSPSPRVFIAHSEWACWRILHLRKGGVGETALSLDLASKFREMEPWVTKAPQQSHPLHPCTHSTRAHTPPTPTRAHTGTRRQGLQGSLYPTFIALIKSSEKEHPHA